jgi:YidC/Oxa1 family membrane protein insertase
MYSFTGSYGLALILFALVAKLILLPFSVKGKKGMMAMARVNPKLQQLQKQYGKDKARYNEEMQKLYKKENVSPMSGCLWSLLPLPVMIGLYTVIRRPLSNLMHLADSQIETIRTMLTNMDITLTSNQAYEQLEMARHISDHFETFQSKIPELINIHFHFLGLDLSQIPQFNLFKSGSFTWAFIGRFLIPFISGATAFFSSRIGMKTNATAKTGNAIADRTSRQMLYTMPLISVWIGFVMPAGLGIYWIFNNLLTMLQEQVIGRRLKKKFEEEEAKRDELERLEAEEEKRQRAEKIAQRAFGVQDEGAGKRRPRRSRTSEQACHRTTSDAAAWTTAPMQGAAPTARNAMRASRPKRWNSR